MIDTFLIVLLIAAPAAAMPSLDGSVEQTSGSNAYYGVSGRLSVDLTESFYVEPSFSTNRSDASGATYRNMALRAGYDAQPWSAGVTASGMPKVNGYRRKALSADVSRRLETNSENLSFELGAAAKHTAHSDDFISTLPVGRRSGSGSGSGGSGSGGGEDDDNTTRATNGVIQLGQTDATVNAGAEYKPVALNASLTLSRYNRDLEALRVRETQTMELANLGAMVRGFPKSSVTVGARWSAKTLLRPDVSYTRTTFQLGGPDLNAYEAGLTLKYKAARLRAGYERYVQAGLPSQNYFNASAGLRY